MSKPTVTVEALGALLSDIATKLVTAQSVLRNGADDSDVAYTVADVMGHIGWLADHGACLAGETTTICGGRATEWMLSDRLRAVLEGRAQ